MTQDDFILAQKVEYTDALPYLLSRGWTRTTSKRDDVAILRKENAEVILPLDRSLADYAESVATVAKRVADVEGGTAQHVLADLCHPRSDLFRAGRTDEGSEDGTLNFEQSHAFISGIHRAILAAACSVERPNERFHRRMALKNAQDFVQRCRLGQTERGSFVIAVHCPLDLEQATAGTPFGRRAVETLVRSVEQTVHLLRTKGAAAITSGESPSPPITANLCDALVEMMPPTERGDLWIGASWSHLVAPPSLPSRVTIDRDLYRSFEDLGAGLRPPTMPRNDLFVGRVIDLHGEDNAAGQLEGDVVLQLQIDSELLRARTTLGPVEYALAVKAHGEQRFLSLRGVLHRRSKSSSIDDAADVKLLE